MLLSDADRELLYERLKRHATEGRLTVDELERRVGAVASAQTSEEAAAAMADLPPLSGQAPSRSRGWRRGHGEADAAALDWRPTDERFRDPRTNRVMRVWVDAAGGRHYVADDPR